MNQRQLCQDVKKLEEGETQLILRQVSNLQPWFFSLPQEIV
jgi:hypothetical protein